MTEPAYIPTPDEIEAATAEIRKSWKDHVFEQRASIHVQPWTVPGAKHHRQ